MAMTMTEKVLASHARVPEVKPGDIVTCALDWIVHIDVVFTADWFAIPNRIARPERHVAIMDHMVPAQTIRDAEAHVEFREFIRRFGIPHVFDIGNHGISHQVLAEQGFALPGQMLACEDSHTCGAGAFNCAGRGLGALGMTYAVCKGESWFQVGETIRYELQGELSPAVDGKDVFLYIAGTYGEDVNSNIEFEGPGIAGLSIANRQCIATMCANLGAEFVLFPFDERLEHYLRERAVEKYNPVESDPDAEYAKVRIVDLRSIVPYIALPDSIPNNCRPVAEIAGLEINQAFIGSCANGRLEDLAVAAGILEGKRVSEGVRLIITPASQQVYGAALRAGYIQRLVDAGAVITTSTCGACYGGHSGLLARGERCVSSSTRNFKGRMGSPDSEVLVASPATVAASSITGKITDPRRYQ